MVVEFLDDWRDRRSETPASRPAATRTILDVLTASREVHVSITTVGGRVYVRLALLRQRASDVLVDRAIESIVRSGSSPRRCDGHRASVDPGPGAA